MTKGAVLFKESSGVEFVYFIVRGSVKYTK